MNPGIISLILFLIELVILGITIKYGRSYRYFINTLAILVLLQLYQLSEFLICTTEYYWIGPIAFTLITFLPPSGYQLATRLVNWKRRDYIVGYLLATGFALFYLLTPESVELKTCNPYYAVYRFSNSQWYGLYYNGMLLYSVGFLFYHLMTNANIARTATKGLLFGYISFMLPMLLLVMFDASTIIMITSVMCKFALMLALAIGIVTNK